MANASHGDKTWSLWHTVLLKTAWPHIRTSRDLHATRRSIRLFLATLSGAFNSHRAYKRLLIHRYCASLLLRTTRNTQQVHTASIKWSTVRKLRYIAVVAAHSKYNARDIKYASKTGSLLPCVPEYGRTRDLQPTSSGRETAHTL